jgi:hypothetical protein
MSPVSEFEIRVAGVDLSIRIDAEDELGAVEAASEAPGLIQDGDELTVYPAGDIPVGADGEDAE